jgi:hypothetical protein
MTLSARFSLLHSDLNDFLFALVGEEQNGMPLNVVSALTRLGVDPWEEGARLAALPKIGAVEALTPMIARLSVGRSHPSDDLVVSRRLVELLPARGRAASPGPQHTTAKNTRYWCVVLGLACLALAAAVLSSLL